MATDNNNPDDERGKKPAPDALTEALARDPRFVMIKPSGKGFVIGGQSPAAPAAAHVQTGRTVFPAHARA